MKAMILAAGFGSRMRPLTLNTPKPMLKVGGKPLIQWHIERLVKADIVDIIINHAWLGDQIENYLGDGKAFGCRIHYSREKEPLETGGGIFKALPMLAESPEDCFLVVNADVFCNVNVDKLITPSIKNGDLGRLLMVENPSWHPDGDFKLNRQTGYFQVQGGEAYTYSGIGLLSGLLFEGCSLGAFGLAPLLHQAIAMEKLQGCLHSGYWSDVGTPYRLRTINEQLLAGELE